MTARPGKLTRAWSPMGSTSAPWMAEGEGQPVAAPLPVAAQILGQPLEQVLEAAEGVDPFLRADGQEVWSVHLLGIQLGIRRSRLEKARQREASKHESRRRARLDRLENVRGDSDWEGPGKPCHRHVLRAWLGEHGVPVEEVNAPRT